MGAGQGSGKARMEPTSVEQAGFGLCCCLSLGVHRAYNMSYLEVRLYGADGEHQLKGSIDDSRRVED